MNASSKLPLERRTPDEMERLLERYDELLSGIARGAPPRSLLREMAETIHGLIGMAAELLRTASEVCDTPPRDRASPAIGALSQRERDVLRHVLAGRTSKEIAPLLHLSPSSVATYRSRLMVKLDARRTSDLVRRALELGLSDDQPFEIG